VYAEKADGRWQEMAERLSARHQTVRRRVYDFASSETATTSEKEKAAVRIEVNDLLVRVSMAALTYSKGTGMLRQKDAQRLVREAMFFLVWSASEDVRAGTLERFLV